MITGKQRDVQFAIPLWLGFLYLGFLWLGVLWRGSPGVGFPGLGSLCLAGRGRPLAGSASNAVDVALGPFAGVAARSWQSCCAENAWAIAPYASASLGAGLAVRWLWRPEHRALGLVRDALWWLAALSWFGAAVLSYLHALE